MEYNVKGELQDKNFSIICNNCIGGFIYQHYGIEYRTPTLGLFIVAKQYIQFLSNIKYYLNQKLVFIKKEDFGNYEGLREHKDIIDFPVAMLGDILVFFMHYENEEEAQSKWYRRINKIRWDDLIVIMGENETCDYETVKQFDALPFKNKVCFTTVEYPDIKTVCCIPEKREPGVQWSAEIIMKHFNMTEFLNSRFK